MIRFLTILTILTSLCALTLAEQVPLYISAAPSGIYRAELDTEKGTLAHLTCVAEFPGGGFLALHPHKPLLYSTTGHGVKAFEIKQDGRLTQLNEQATGGHGTCHVSIDSTGNIVLAADYSSGSVAAFRITESGRLSERSGFSQHQGSSIHPQRQTAPHAHAALMGPTNRFAYVPDLGIDEVKIYKVDAKTGSLKAAGFGKLAPGAGPRHLKFSKDGKFAFVLNELSLSVTTFAINAETGALAEKATVSALEGTDWPEMTCAEIRVHPSGRFLYTSQRDLRTGGPHSTDELGRNSLSVFRIERDGSLQRIQTVPAGVRIPRNFNLDPSGHWLIVGGQASNTIRLFQVAADGQLTEHGTHYNCPGPICFEFPDA